MPLLIPPTLAALWILRRRGAQWFLVPAVFPATQFYYVAMALPALVGRPLIAAALALPMILLTPIVVIAFAAWTVYEARAHRATPAPTTEPAVSP